MLFRLFGASLVSIASVVLMESPAIVSGLQIQQYSPSYIDGKLLQDGMAQIESDVAEEVTDEVEEAGAAAMEQMKELTESAEGAIEDAAIQAATDANDAVAVSIDDLVGDP